MDSHQSENKSENFFSRQNMENLSEHVSSTDTDVENGLVMFSYKNCNNETDSNIKKCRGLVYQGDKLILKAFPYTDEYVYDEKNKEKIKEVLGDFSKWVFHKAYEGALLRLYFVENKWYLSTHRKFDAFKSKWSCRESFGALFKLALADEYTVNTSFRERVGGDVKDVYSSFTNTLDKSKQYMFLLLNNDENRIVCDAPDRHTVLHAATFTSPDSNPDYDDDCGLPHPEKLEIKNEHDLEAFMNLMNSQEIQGVICSRENEQVKIVHPEYSLYYKVRGNVPSVRFRYLQIRTDTKTRNLMYELYPDSSEEFQEVENILNETAKTIHKAYMDRFVHKNFVQLPQEEYFVMTACHSWHLENRDVNKVTLKDVVYFLNKQPPTNLNKIVHRFLENKKIVVPPIVRNSPALAGVSPGASPSIIPIVLKKSGVPFSPPKLNLNE